MITEYSVTELKKLLEEGKLTSRQITENFLERCEKLNPDINAFLYINKEEALEEADKKDRERSEGKAEGRLHGIPVALKDNMAAEGMQMTNASKFMEGFIAPYDATVVRKIKDEGGIILGKLNMDEFAMGSYNEFSAFGPVKNPWDRERTPGGSSGGSAAAVAALMTPISLGTDTGGSVRQPAAFTGLTGLKPTYGRISRYGITAFGSTLDQVGILSHGTEDCALMLSVLAGEDPMDSTTLEGSGTDFSDFEKGDLKGIKIGIPVKFLEGLNADIKENFDRVAEELKKLGAEVEEIDLEYTHLSLAVYYIVASAEASSNLARFDGIRYGVRAENSGTITDLYKDSRTEGFGEEVKRRIMLGTYVLSSGYYDAYYNTALKVRTVIIEEFKKVFEKYDAVMTPSSPVFPKKLGEKGASVLDAYLNDLYTVPANIAGIPAMTVPSGFRDGLPQSFQLLGNYMDEKKLLQISYAYEKEHDFVKTFPEGVK